MINRSKIRDPRQWTKWKSSGAVRPALAKEYFHTTSEEGMDSFRPFLLHLNGEQIYRKDLGEKIVNYGDASVLLVGVRDRNTRQGQTLDEKTNVIVPGFLFDYHSKRSEFGLNISIVSSVHPSEYEAVESLARKQFKDVDNVWIWPRIAFFNVA